MFFLTKILDSSSKAIPTAIPIIFLRQKRRVFVAAALQLVPEVALHAVGDGTLHLLLETQFGCWVDGLLVVYRS